MAHHDERFDDLFLRAAGTAGGIEPLLKAFCSFLNRRTDFYIVHPGVKGQTYAAGFKRGRAEEMLLESFRGWPMRSLEPGQFVEEKKQPPKKKKESKPPPQALQDVKYSEKGLQIPIGNGGVGATYTWTQTLEEVTIFLEVEPGTRAKDVHCEIGTNSLLVATPATDVRIQGKLYASIRNDGSSMWTLDRLEEHEDGRASLVVTLEKNSETWWASVLSGAPKGEKVDTTLVDSTKKMDEYDEKTQAGIRKIMFDQRQKRQGKRTSDQLKMDDILEKCKNLPGSPFLPEDDPPKPPKKGI